MSRYRNRPDRRAQRIVSPLIQPVMPYTGIYVGDVEVDFEFAEDIMLNGMPEMLCINGAGGVVSHAIAATVMSGNVVRIEFDTDVNTESHLFFFRSQQTALRGVTGGWPTNEPVLVTAV